MVAGLIAKDLASDLYQVDISKIVSKYIGETEKNLAGLFDAADATHAILLFDEADSLFGKRTDVKSTIGMPISRPTSCCNDSRHFKASACSPNRAWTLRSSDDCRCICDSGSPRHGSANICGARCYRPTHPWIPASTSARSRGRTR